LHTQNANLFQNEAQNITSKLLSYIFVYINYSKPKALLFNELLTVIFQDLLSQHFFSFV